jgi:hypothetical protein
LTESLKLIVVIATILFGGLLAYRSNIAAPIGVWAYYVSLALLASSSILSVTNINSLINKVYRGEEDAIKKKEVKVLNFACIATLFSGIAFGAWFLSVQSQMILESPGADAIVISDESIAIGKEIRATVKVVITREGTISEVLIGPN